MDFRRSIDYSEGWEWTRELKDLEDLSMSLPSTIEVELAPAFESGIFMLSKLNINDRVPYTKEGTKFRDTINHSYKKERPYILALVTQKLGNRKAVNRFEDGKRFVTRISKSMKTESYFQSLAYHFFILPHPTYFREKVLGKRVFKHLNLDIETIKVICGNNDYQCFKALACYYLNKKVTSRKGKNYLKEAARIKNFTDEEILEIGRLIPCEGNLAQTKNGFIYLKVNDLFIHLLCPLIEHKGFQVPPFFSTDSVGAHVTVIKKKEFDDLELVDKQASLQTLGQISFKINDLQFIETKNWFGFDRAAILTLSQCKPLKLERMARHLTSKINGFKFHITIGVIPTGRQRIVDKRFSQGLIKET